MLCLLEESRACGTAAAILHTIPETYKTVIPATLVNTCLWLLCFLMLALAVCGPRFVSKVNYFAGVEGTVVRFQPAVGQLFIHGNPFEHCTRTCPILSQVLLVHRICMAIDNLVVSSCCTGDPNRPGQPCEGRDLRSA